ncbi:hypothetical protein IWQ61_001716 [Dispira simplex]|nr:hypothetical protein IWQ61_001716 [Dispira simplex]
MPKVMAENLPPASALLATYPTLSMEEFIQCAECFTTVTQYALPSSENWQWMPATLSQIITSLCRSSGGYARHCRLVPKQHSSSELSPESNDTGLSDTNTNDDNEKEDTAQVT